MDSSLHLGLTPWSLRDTHTAQILGEQAQFGEACGYESFWLPEHHFTSGSAIPDPLMLLAAVAAMTTKLRLGTTSYLLPLRQPLLAAEQVAVLDQLSAGRLTLGIGRGYAPELFSTFGVDRSRKRKLLKNCLDIMQRAWAGQVVGDEPGATAISPLPVQKPHPPIWVAAFGPLALKQAGSLGCPYLASPGETFDRLRGNLSIHREACEGAGLPIPSEVPIMRTVFCSRNRSEIEGVRSRLNEQAAQMAREVDDRQTPITVDDWALIGEPAFIRDMAARYQAELDVTHLVVTRLRIGGVASETLKQSVALTAETLLA
ncbi:MAG: LLM class flavin-dependent oxidoreductase [Gammaproteobacteria bacterium]|nr:LLM class flavin-dependent oxidoreductase [Gammaproteobacteria bacterium]